MKASARWIAAGDATPWGEAQYVHVFPGVEGVFHVGTASHGGFMVSRAAWWTMPQGLRMIGAPFGGVGPRGDADWYCYEEDCCWAAVAVAFPGIYEGRPAEEAAFSARAARETLRHYYPKHVDEHGTGCGRATPAGSFHRCEVRP